jgi:L-rhamnonate dehydratase
MACRTFPLIKEVRAYIAEADVAQHVQGADCHDVQDTHWINGNLPLGDGPEPELLPIATPMSVHPAYQRHRKSWGINALGSMVVEIEADDGTCGAGVSIGGSPGCYIVERHLSRFVEGQDPRNIELMWDQMFRATLNYGRKGLPVQALSAVDLALWDLLGKLRQEPVYMLLGGATKAVLPMYCTTARPEAAKKLGFVGCKIACPFGPASGPEGMRKNVEFFQQARQKVGEGFPLMLDCYMAMTVPYSIALARRLAQPDLHFTWMEEFLPPDEYDGYEEVKKAVGNLGLLLTTGEHEYSRFGFKQLIDKKVAHILQPDITWLGGITEARRVMALASANDVLVVPHGSSIYSYHLQFAFLNAPLGEFINLTPDGCDVKPYFGALFKDEPLPKDGKISLEQISKPGFGCTLVKDGLKRPYPRSPEAAAAHRARTQAAWKEQESAPPVFPLVGSYMPGLAPSSGKRKHDGGSSSL